MRNSRIIIGTLTIAAAIVFGFMFTEKLVENQRALADSLSYQPAVAGTSITSDSSK
ncbi:MAG: hypothetical protein ACM3NH_03775 [Candidatus Saccharibacteria bacterium]